MGIDRRIIPSGKQQLAMGHNLSGVARQCLKQIKLLGRKFDLLVHQKDLSFEKVDPQVTRFKLLAFHGLIFPAPDSSPNPRQKLLDIERLVDEIIRPLIQCRNLFCFLVAGRQDQDRQGVQAEQFRDDFLAIGIGQSEVEQDNIKHRIFRLFQCLGGCAG